MSDSQNHTGIEDLVELHKNPSPFLGTGSPEGGSRISGEQVAPHQAIETSGGDFEKENIGSESVEMHEVVEHEPDPEVKEYVEVRQETPEVPPDMKKLGVQASTPQNFTGYQKVQLPISDDQILQGKKQPITDSIRWLAEFCIFLLKQAHIQLKIAHGKAQRVFKK
jgi:hypothetical protein